MTLWSARLLAAAIAWSALAVGVWRLRQDLWRPRQALGLHALEWLLLWGVTFVIAAAAGVRHLDGRLDAHNIGLLPMADTSIFDLYFRDFGIPSLTHDLLRVLSFYVGGFWLLVPAQAALASVYVLFSYLVMRAGAGPWVAAAALPGIALYEQTVLALTELRCYPSFLATLCIGLFALVHRQLGLALIALGLATLDYPLCGVVLLGSAGWLALDAAPPWRHGLLRWLPWRAIRDESPAVRLWGAALLLLGSLTPVIFLALQDYGRLTAAPDRVRVLFGSDRWALYAVALAGLLGQLRDPRLGPIAAGTLAGAASLAELFHAEVLHPRAVYHLFLLPGAVASTGASAAAVLKLIAPLRQLDGLPALAAAWFSLRSTALFLPHDLETPTAFYLQRLSSESAPILLATAAALVALQVVPRRWFEPRALSRDLAALFATVAFVANLIAQFYIQSAHRAGFLTYKAARAHTLAGGGRAARMTTSASVSGFDLLLRKAEVGDAMRFAYRPALNTATLWVDTDDAVCAARSAWVTTERRLDCSPCTLQRHLVVRLRPHEGLYVWWCSTDGTPAPRR